LSGSLNDLWRLDPLTNNWTWVKGDSIPNAAASYGTIGVETAANKPGGRGGSASWTDASGKLWIFGGSNPEGAELNDLWSYNVSSGNWTWEKGTNDLNPAGEYGMQGVPAPGNNPGGRVGSCTWTDKAGNFGFSVDLLIFLVYVIAQPSLMMTCGSSILQPATGRG
jgi:hypothetical protein